MQQCQRQIRQMGEQGSIYPSTLHQRAMETLFTPVDSPQHDRHHHSFQTQNSIRLRCWRLPVSGFLLLFEQKWRLTSYKNLVVPKIILPPSTPPQTFDGEQRKKKNKKKDCLCQAAYDKSLRQRQRGCEAAWHLHFYVLYSPWSTDRLESHFNRRSVRQRPPNR